MRTESDIRLFFALWPDDDVRDRIAGCLKQTAAVSGRLVPRHNWHMTLHFIGNTTFEEKDCLHRQAKKIQFEAFEITLDKTGFFSKPKVLWLGSRNPPQALFDCQHKLGRRLGQCEYAPEARPYSPHITVLRKVTEKPDLKPLRPIRWFVDRFVLIESIAQADGVRYQVIEEYPFLQSENND